LVFYAIIYTMVETGSSDQSGLSSQLKIEKYEKCFGELEAALGKLGASATEVQKQKALCDVLAAAFKGSWNFVGFYDLRPEVHSNKVFIGEYVSEAVFPCGEIDLGHGQCGLCAKDEKVMIAHDVSKLDNYIACDDDTKSEIVLPCFLSTSDAEEDDEDECSGDAGGTGSATKKRKLRTLLDIDSIHIGTFDETD
jgi:putative methionine-R-sulfoxide reductase with GAF domain